MIDRLASWLLDLLDNRCDMIEEEDYTERVRTWWPLELVHHSNSTGTTLSVNLLRWSLFSYYMGLDRSHCWWTPLWLWGEDPVTGYILKLFGRTVWSSPTQEE